MSIDFNLHTRETEQSSAHKNTQDLLSFIKWMNEMMVKFILKTSGDQVCEYEYYAYII